MTPRSRTTTWHDSRDAHSRGIHENRAMTGRAIAIGDVAPEIRLVDSSGVTRSLTKALDTGPVVLLFYRGHW